MMRLSSLAFRTACRSSSRAFATVPLPSEQSSLDKLHDIIESYRLSNFPETVPHDFVDLVLYAADENKDGLISVDEMQTLLRNLYSHQPIDREEVIFIMERDLDMAPNTDTVPMDKVRQLLLEIHH